MNRQAKGLAIVFGVLVGISTAQGAFASTSADAFAHYQLANALVRTGKHPEAIEEYRTAYRLFPESRIGAESLKALNAYHVDLTSPSQSENEIKRQSQELTAETNRETEAKVKQTTRGANDRLANIDADKNAAITNVVNNPSIQTAIVPLGNRFYGPRYYGGRYGYYTPSAIVSTVDPVATQARIDAVKANAEAAKEKVKADTADQVEHMRAYSQERSRIIDETANNLESQMSGRGVKLKSQGTNLYVRQY